MHKFVIFVATVALAACSESGEDQVDQTAEVQATTEGAGLFDYSSADGTATGRMDMRADGTYTDYQDGAEPRTGTWYATESETCMRDDAEGSEEMCWADSEPDENGTFTSTSPTGEVANVTPVSDDDVSDDESSQQDAG